MILMMPTHPPKSVRRMIFIAGGRRFASLIHGHRLREQMNVDKSSCRRLQHGNP